MLAAAVVIVLGACCTATAQVSEGLLFGDAPQMSRALGPGNADPTVMRSRGVSVNAAALPTPTTPANSPVAMNFFDGEVVDVVLEKLTEHAPGRYVWAGHVFGEPETSSVTLSVNGSVFVGNVRMDKHYYQIRTSTDATPMVVEIDETRFPSCGTTHEHAVKPPAQSPARSVGPRDTSDTFDVLVVYTPSARDAVGGKASMEALIDLAISETNTIYANSLINSQVRLVHQEMVDYGEISFSTDLGNVRNKTDGYMDEVHTLRDEFGADMVSLIINDSQFCGLAGLMTVLGNYFESSAFSVVHHSCATGYYSFAHEMGHNQGAMHAVGDSGTTQGSGLYDYSHGWRWTSTNSTQYRSVMAYIPGIRVDHFSNPNVQYIGGDTGVTDEADNARGLNNAADTVANWRTQATGLAVTPGAPFTITSDTGDSLSGTTQDFTLHNLGDSAIDWTANEAVAWADLSATSGTIPANSTVVISFVLNSAANSLNPATYSATLTVEDTTNVTTHERDLSVAIYGPKRYVVTMDSDPGWSTTGSWEFGEPLGLGSTDEIRDPTSGYTGSNVYGYNLAGDYPNLMGEETLTSTAFDLTGITSTQVSFYRWLGVEKSPLDHAKFQVSVNGTAWTTVWSNLGELAEREWREQTYDIASLADDQPTVYLRWVMGSSDVSVTYFGWNIDDVSIRGALAESSLSEVWVDFGGDGLGLGTLSNPFSALEEAADKVVATGAGIVRIKGDSADTDSSESLSISKPMTIQSENGTVQVGVSP